MNLPVSTSSRSRQLFAPVGALLFGATELAATFPGQLGIDGHESLRQAIVQQYGDWQPPVMALVWSWLLRISGNPGSLLVCHQFLHWLGFGLMADGCMRANMPRRACVILAAGAFPFFVFYDRIVLKDVGMGSALIAASGLMFWFVVQKKSIPVWAVLLSAIFILYATLIRTNAVFALGPILCLYLVRGRQLSLTRVVGVWALSALLTVPLSDWINHRLIGAKLQDPIQSLQLFDLMGIAVRSGDIGVLDDESLTMNEITACYTSYWWDTLSPWGICAPIYQQIKYVSWDTVTPQVSVRGVLWRRAILAHPLAYMAHRLSYFNSSIYFLVPALHFRYSKTIETRLITPRDIKLDYIKRPFVFAPVLWLSLGLSSLVLLRQPGPVSPVMSFGRLLTMSGLLYSGAYLLVGVATDHRYYYWSVMAILLSLVLTSPDIAAQSRRHPWRGKSAAFFVVVVVVLGYAARVVDLPLF
jgi:hypothetical protein